VAQRRINAHGAYIYQEGRAWMKRSILKVILFSICFFSILFLLFTPVLNLNISDRDELLLSLPVHSGETLTTGYIHSVQLTPVEDDYRIIDDSIWLWEERVVSHNAGLPVEAPRNGRFFQDRSWMYVQGGRYSFEKIMLRVGDSDLGRNWMKLGNTPEVPLYKEHPSTLLKIYVTEMPLVFSCINKQVDLLQNR
jgi:hypothetical protein